MTIKTITLSRELVECDACPASGGCVGKCMKAPTDPVPPAGVDVEDATETFEYRLEMLGAIDRCDVACGFYGDKFHQWTDTGPFVEYDDHLKHVELYKGEVTRLQAEVERLKASSAELRDRKNSIVALQAELTKALELLRISLDFPFSIAHQRHIELFLSNQSAPADKECAHRFMSLADDPRRCADCDAVEMHDKPVVRLELVRSGMSEGLHIRVWENLGNLWPGVHMLYLGPAEQPAPAAAVMPFDFEHPLSKERRTVTLTKRDVFDGMEDYFYDKLSEQICQCESVGETNVVDCNCDEYVHDFEIVQACLDEVGRLNSDPKP